MVRRQFARSARLGNKDEQKKDYHRFLKAARTLLSALSHICQFVPMITTDSISGAAGTRAPGSALQSNGADRKL
jgi:hypothetical protein